jgi:hypothetical protein
MSPIMKKRIFLDYCRFVLLQLVLIKLDLQVLNLDFQLRLLCDQVVVRLLQIDLFGLESAHQDGVVDLRQDLARLDIRSFRRHCLDGERTAAAQGGNRNADGLYSRQLAGNLCWFINGSICEGSPQGSWEKKMNICRECEVYRSILPLKLKGSRLKGH